ncbi:energy transducer TonB [Hymenobacter sp. B1770]|uniref:energy transducer TonB n=1 Tax=Hymenobacter sp. B1770 TaxID=1718788 RepID=UPI003CF6B9DC
MPIAEYIQSKLVYPDVASANRKSGRVFASFYVDSDGRIQQGKVVKGLDPIYDAAVVVAVEKLPRFTPGTQNNKPVSVTFTVPVEFTR